LSPLPLIGFFQLASRSSPYPRFCEDFSFLMVHLPPLVGRGFSSSLIEVSQPFFVSPPPSVLKLETVLAYLVLPYPFRIWVFELFNPLFGVIFFLPSYCRTRSQTPGTGRLFSRSAMFLDDRSPIPFMIAWFRLVLCGGLLSVFVAAAPTQLAFSLSAVVSARKPTVPASFPPLISIAFPQCFSFFFPSFLLPLLRYLVHLRPCEVINC